MFTCFYYSVSVTFATSLVNVAPIVEGCSTYAERGFIINLSYPASCRMKGLGIAPSLCDC